MTSTVTRDRSEIAGREEENGVMRRKYEQQLATERGGRAAVVFGGRRGGNTTAGQRVTVKLEKGEYEEGVIRCREDGIRNTRKSRIIRSTRMVRLMERSEVFVLT